MRCIFRVSPSQVEGKLTEDSSRRLVGSEVAVDDDVTLRLHLRSEEVVHQVIGTLPIDRLKPESDAARLRIEVPGRLVHESAAVDMR